MGKLSLLFLGQISMLSRLWKIILPGILAILLLVILWLYPQLELPALRGPHTVGQTVLRWVDTSRPEVLTEEPGDFREVVVQVWYPAQAGTGTKAGYFSNLSTVSQALVQSGEVEWWQAFGLRFVRSEVLLDARLQKESRPFPVILFSPGNGTNIEFYSSLVGEIASHGYIVVGLNHPYDVPAVELSNGKVAVYNKDQWSLKPDAHQAYSMERVKVRTADMLYVLEQLEEMNASGTFAGGLDLDSVAAAGHSLGGITASEACQADPRFRACLNFDGLQKGGPFSMEESAVPPKQPFMFMTKESQLHPEIIERFEHMPESYWVIVHDASHQSFTDSPMLVPVLWPETNRARHLMDFIQQYSLAFLDETLNGRSSHLLSNMDGESVSVQVFPSN